jgi:hypothetical protein
VMVVPYTNLRLKYLFRDRDSRRKIVDNTSNAGTMATEISGQRYPSLEIDIYLSPYVVTRRNCPKVDIVGLC